MIDVSDRPAAPHLFSRGWSITSKALLAAVALLFVGCAATVKQAAEAAAPAAVEEAVEEAKEPSTRDAVAEILDDPDIRASSAELSEAVTAGVVRGVEQQVPVDQLQRLSDALVASVGASLARSLERDVGPHLSKVVARVIDESLAHAVNEQTEARLQAMVAMVARATSVGITEATSQTKGADADLLDSPSAQLTRNAWYGLGYNGAQGFERAVREAHAQATSDEAPGVLATLGTLASWARLLPLVLLGLGATLVVGLAAALAWALIALRRERRLSLERTAIHRRSSEGHGATCTSRLEDRFDDANVSLPLFSRHS